MYRERNGKLTGRLEPFDVPGGAQEVAPQEQEGGKQRRHGDEDPGYDHRCHRDDPQHLEEDLGHTGTVGRRERSLGQG